MASWSRHLLSFTLLTVPLQMAAQQTVTANDGYVASTGGVRIYYRVVGNGPDTVILVHGGPGANMGSIFPDLQPLTAHHTLILYDQRGGGRSTLPADTTLLDARYFVDDLDAVRRHFRLARVTLIAHSFGPIIAALYAQTHPERVARMIFTGAIPPRQEEAMAWWNEMQRQAQAADSALTRRMRALDSTLITGSASDPAATCRERDQVAHALAAAKGDTIRWRGTSCDASPEAIRYGMRYTSQLTPQSLGAWDFTKSMQRVTAPLLVVYGAKDTAPIESQIEWAAAVPNGVLVVIPGAGHGPQAGRPDLVFPLVDSFLRGEWPGAR
jgi:proline iminopeptidase